MKQFIKGPLSLIVAAVTLIGTIAAISNLDSTAREAASILLTALVSSFIAYLFGRGVRDKRRKVLDHLGVTRVYGTAKEDDSHLTHRLETAKKIRILAINAEMLLRNLPMAFKNALQSGTKFEVLISLPNSEFVHELEKMRKDGSRGQGRSIEQDIRETEPALLSLLKEAMEDLPLSDHHRLGSISLGHFNTQYRESMIICNDDWVWWTPHLHPARAAQRPTFVFQGQEATFTRMCIKHFEAVKKMVSMKVLTLSIGENNATHAV